MTEHKEEEATTFKSKLVELITRNDQVASQMIGYAVVILFGRQTDSEQDQQTVKHKNSRGFAASDAKMGSVHAEYFLRHNTLEADQIEYWLETSNHNEHRLAKYWRQIAEEVSE